MPSNSVSGKDKKNVVCGSITVSGKDKKNAACGYKNQVSKKIYKP